MKNREIEMFLSNNLENGKIHGANYQWFLYQYDKLQKKGYIP